MAVALHTYLLDKKDRIFARITTYAPTEEEAQSLADDVDFDSEDSIEILEDDVEAPSAEEMRAVEDSQLDDEEPEEEGDGEEEEEGVEP